MGSALCCAEEPSPSHDTTTGAAVPEKSFAATQHQQQVKESLNESAFQHQLMISDIGIHSSNPIILTTTRRESGEEASEGVRLDGCQQRRPRGLSRKCAGGRGGGGGNPPHQQPARVDASAFRTILSSQQEPLGPPRLFTQEQPQHQRDAQAYQTTGGYTSALSPQQQALYHEGGLQALLRVTMEREAALRQLAREKLPEVHLLGAQESQLKEQGNNNSSAGGSFINRKSDKDTTGGSQVPTLLSSAGDGGGAGPALTPNSRPRRESQDADAPLSVIECTVEPPSCPNDGADLVDSSDPMVLSDKDIIALRPPRRHTPAAANNPLVPPVNSQGTSTTSGGTTSHRFSIHNALGGEEREPTNGGIRPLESWSSPTTLYAQSSGGIPSLGQRPSVSDAFGSHSQLTSRQSTISSHQSAIRDIPVTMGSQNPLGLLAR
ncbi:Hypothetical protein, putative [Bodo saltans]|uniref:Uncharacterized protein n=1 Tax=Bodo saltans TaxID=75058 RepID=A0A0S4KK50_BODSA|nr:Hypothetical protein, putative [Bodo saltans]|eukprot:CUI14967.1 Hypothetical protein, putative [Bodo saltans]